MSSDSNAVRPHQASPDPNSPDPNSPDPNSPDPNSPDPNKPDRHSAETDASLPISGLQHLAFCPRQWGLIHLEQSWQENRLTAEGKLLHERVDLPGQTRRDQVRSVRGMWLRSQRLGLYGRADLVEFSPLPYPVEYKRGKRKPTDCDAVQLCAQALCLEEMLEQPVSHGAFFYGDPRRRLEVAFTAPLRERTATLAHQMQALFQQGKTPPAVPGFYCRSCSLVDVCLPVATQKAASAQGWIEKHLRTLEREEDREQPPNDTL